MYGPNHGLNRPYLESRRIGVTILGRGTEESRDTPIPFAAEIGDIRTGLLRSRGNLGGNLGLGRASR